MNQQQKMSKTVAICGGSWFSGDLNLPGQSFGEIMCAKNNWQLYSLARGGCSNFAVSLQVDKAIDLNVDVVVIGPTTPDRCEFPIINDQNTSIWDQLKKSFNFLSWFRLQPDVYVKERGISNILHNMSLSSKYPWISNPTIVSESLNNLLWYNYDKGNKLTAEQLDALRMYMLNLYDSGIKRQMDCWIISDACRRLEFAGIPYLIFPEELYQNYFEKDISWIPEKNVITDFSVQKLPKGTAEFHYDIINGTNIMFADYVELKSKDLI